MTGAGDKHQDDDADDRAFESVAEQLRALSRPSAPSHAHSALRFETVLAQVDESALDRRLDAESRQLRPLIASLPRLRAPSSLVVPLESLVPTDSEPLAPIRQLRGEKASLRGLRIAMAAGLILGVAGLTIVHGPGVARPGPFDAETAALEQRDALMIRIVVDDIAATRPPKPRGGP